MGKNNLFDSIQNLRKVVNEDGDLFPPEQIEEKPEITDELIEELFNGLSDSTGIDKVQFATGLQAELEHYDTVNKEMSIIANIVADHLKEFPGKDYYAALSQMEHELAETPEEETTEHAPGGEEGPASEEIPAGEAPVVEPPVGAMEGKIPANPAAYSEKDIKTLMEDDLKYVPKGEYALASETGEVIGKLRLEKAVEGEVIKNENGKKLIKLDKINPDDTEIKYVLVDVPLEAKVKEVGKSADKVEKVK